ncbi:hypothetical protein LVJ83_04775 [Uruburuella testudinis]|uniref:Uncharacterized protein n=1 Tax=Uruburuella testudinis TaxID=1282863 RepID=A0ABY4DWC5_9NEIS|nr:hypothetical protein [Uruburuella testudinis]UOO82783.1 hypothetical protein LVJ83_04775 [Uruburuella testudinis]
MKAKVYALYKGDELIGTGTAFQLAKKLGITVRSLLYYKTPNYMKRNRGQNHRQLVALEEDDES